jgi:hypothetical protein
MLETSGPVVSVLFLETWSGRLEFGLRSARKDRIFSGNRVDVYLFYGGWDILTPHFGVKILKMSEMEIVVQEARSVIECRTLEVLRFQIGVNGLAEMGLVISDKILVIAS